MNCPSVRLLSAVPEIAVKNAPKIKTVCVCVCAVAVYVAAPSLLTPVPPPQYAPQYNAVGAGWAILHAAIILLVTGVA